ncbi:MAG TPA: hypothetical protein VI911_11295 [Patescibacteria group bacterium]|nr:hypothetical protein [Patescibacteria group bacterium]
MKRSYLITQLADLYESIPKGASAYHICDMLIYKAEKLGMLSPSNVPFSINPVVEEDGCGNQTRLKDLVGWEDESDEDWQESFCEEIDEHPKTIKQVLKEESINNQNCPLCDKIVDTEGDCTNPKCNAYGYRVRWPLIVSCQTAITDNTKTVFKACPECEGSGFIGKLYPSGHTEVKCERCSGEGMIEDED